MCFVGIFELKVNLHAENKYTGKHGIEFRPRRFESSTRIYSIEPRMNEKSARARQKK